MNTVGIKFPKRTVRKAPLAGQTVLVRTDYNVPLDSKGAITDDLRIQASLPTIRRLLRDGCKVVIISHLGRPDGTPNPKESLEPVAARLAQLLGRDVRFVDHTVGHKVRMAVRRAPKASVIMLENLRFDSREEANDATFAKQLAHDSGARYFVQDGFGVVHRAHASTSAITMELPSVAGLLLEREYLAITSAMQRPRRPLVALLGGAKVSDKIGVIEKLIDVADQIVLGGAMANTFLAYKGNNMAKSKVETDQTQLLDSLYKKVAHKVGADMVDHFLVLPSDVAIGDQTDQQEPRRVVPVSAVPPGYMALDIGPRSIKRMERALRRAQTVIWNGTMGLAELPHFSLGSQHAAKLLATNHDITSIIGGGDTAGFVEQWDARHGASFSHVSTGGGASLELMAGKSLPGIDALLDA